jgi:hypothetical protein
MAESRSANVRSSTQILAERFSEESEIAAHFFNLKIAPRDGGFYSHFFHLKYMYGATAASTIITTAKG